MLFARQTLSDSVDLFVSREPTTFSQLHRFGFPNSRHLLSADLAFLIDPLSFVASPGDAVVSVPSQPFRLAFVRSNNMPLDELRMDPPQGTTGSCLRRVRAGNP